MRFSWVQILRSHWLGPFCCTRPKDKPSHRRGVSLQVEELENRTVPSVFPAVLSLSSLDGFNGFAANGIADGEGSGTSVSNAGDVNGDGFDDLIIGAPIAAGGGSARGQAYVVFGKSSGMGATFELSSLNGTNGFTLNGIANYDLAGYSVSGAGDVNGDGFDDLIVGAPSAGAYSGQAYVIFGKNTPFAVSLDLSSLDGSNGFTLKGIVAIDHAGQAVGGAGDVNDDGFDDLIVGAPDANASGSFRGQAYVVFGKSTAFAASLDLSSLNGANGFSLNGIADDDQAGRSVSGAGDVNGDGIDDLIVGAPEAAGGGSNRGQAYVVFGKTTAFGASLDLSSLDGSNGFALNGIANNDYAGRAVSGAGDVNGDGFDDVIVGAPVANAGGVDRGQAYVVFGKSTAFAASLNLSSLNGTNGFALNGILNTDNAGAAVSAAGDVNGDSFGDIIIGAPSAAGGTLRGQAYVVLGESGGFGSSLDLSSLNGANGFTLNGIANGDSAGFAVSGGGDFNGDGLADVIVSAPNADAGGTARGQTYVIFVRNPHFIVTAPDKNSGPLVKVFRDDGTFLSSIVPYGITFTGGVRVAVGDVNGDGQVDIITAPGSGLAQIKVFDGLTFQPLATLPNGLVAYQPGFLKGAYVAAGDVFGDDGIAEIVVAPNSSKQPAKVFDAAGNQLLSFFPYGAAFTGGVKVAVGDVTGGTENEIVTLRGGATATSLVRAFDNTGTQLLQFTASSSANNFLAVGNTDGTAKAEIIVGLSGKVMVFDSTGTPQGTTITPYAGFKGKIRVAALDVNGDGAADIITGPAKGRAAEVKVFNGVGHAELDSFFAYESDFLNGIFVAAG